MIHDWDHQGLNNDFLIKTRHPLAILYKDQSPNENHHVAGAYHLLVSDRQASFAEDMTAEDRNIFRASVIELVLGTDMKKHFGYVSQFQVRIPLCMSVWHAGRFLVSILILPTTQVFTFLPEVLL